ncbi:MAG TPA: 2-hydroxyacyl-CoA dehydratase [bacterium]|nr:2-hydroxyacyl-CoA dehydratase [bacterium]
MMIPAEIGITSSVPIEVIYAAGARAIDLNNVFIERQDSWSLVEQAERRGFPESSCAWIKGIYSAIALKGIKTVIAVTEGDCSNTHALMEVLETEGIETIPFMYPCDRDRRFLELQMAKLMDRFGVGGSDVERVRTRFAGIRAKVREIDRLTWEEGRVGGFDNHYYHISCSDMKGDPSAFEREIDSFVASARKREPIPADLRVAYVGIPPILDGIYSLVEAYGGQVVFNELQRQFSMFHDGGSLVDQYLLYTYPYHIQYRLEDIKTELGRRHVDGVIHYVQAFCFRQIEDMILRKELDRPVLTLEGNRPGKADLRSRVRIEAFLDMLRCHKQAR